MLSQIYFPFSAAKNPFLPATQAKRKYNANMLVQRWAQGENGIDASKSKRIS